VPSTVILGILSFLLSLSVIGSGFGQFAAECGGIGHTGRVANRPFIVQLLDLGIHELDISDMGARGLSQIGKCVLLFVDGDGGGFGFGHEILSIL
jgi:hypothetical protein